MQPDSEKNIVGKYRLGKVLGAGDFDCTIRIATLQNGDKFAVRVYSKAVLAEKGSWQQLADAVQVVRTLPRSERIVETVECFETASSLYILMAFAPGVSLYKLMLAPQLAKNSAHHFAGLESMVRLDMDDKRLIFQQLLQGLQHLHSHDVAHMGLAPDHVLIHLNRPSLASAASVKEAAASSAAATSSSMLSASSLGGLLGAAGAATPKFSVRIGFLVACKKVDPGQKMSHLCGTTHTVAPEVLRQVEPYDPFKADIWSAGVVLYFMLSDGKYPFDGANTSKHILAHNVRPLNPAIPADARELALYMMSPDPAKRPTLQQVLEHPWMGDKQALARNTKDLLNMAIQAKRDEQTGRILLRVMPLTFPRKEQAARIIQAVWRLVRYRPLNRGGKDQKKRGGRKGGSGGADGKPEGEWGLTVESGSDVDSDENNMNDSDEDGGSDRVDKGGAAGALQKRLKMMEGTKSTVPPMPPSLIAHDVRCKHCGRVPATTFQPGSKPFPKAKVRYDSITGTFMEVDDERGSTSLFGSKKNSSVRLATPGGSTPPRSGQQRSNSDRESPSSAFGSFKEALKSRNQQLTHEQHRKDMALRSAHGSHTHLPALAQSLSGAAAFNLSDHNVYAPHASMTMIGPSSATDTSPRASHQPESSAASSKAATASNSSSTGMLRRAESGPFSSMQHSNASGTPSRLAYREEMLFDGPAAMGHRHRKTLPSTELKLQMPHNASASSANYPVETWAQRRGSNASVTSTPVSDAGFLSGE